MKIFHGIIARAGIAAALVWGIACTSRAADITRLAGANPNALKGNPERLGDTPTQSNSSLDRLGQTLASLGLGFGDVCRCMSFWREIPSGAAISIAPA